MDLQNVPIDDLLYYNRYPDGYKRWLFYAYFPFGCLLALLRLFIGLHAFIISIVLPKSSYFRCLILRALSVLLGVIVTQENVQKRTKGARVIIANHISVVDCTAIMLIQPCILQTTWKLPRFLQQALGCVYFGSGSTAREAIIYEAQQYASNHTNTILTFPEGAVTNGQVGLLKFDPCLFAIESAFQPVLLSLSRPSIADVAPSVIGSTWYSDLFWTLLVPYTVYKLEWLTAINCRKELNESFEEFALRAQNQMSLAAGWVPTKHTSRDLQDYTKRVLVDLRQRRQQEQQQRKVLKDNSKIDVLVSQVKTVLPQVPLAIIRTDIELTGNVTTTIANLLEGRVTYDPEPVSIPVPKKTPTLQVNNPNTWRYTFEERKRQLIDHNRRLYLIRKGHAPQL